MNPKQNLKRAAAAALLLALCSGAEEAEAQRASPPQQRVVCDPGPATPRAPGERRTAGTEGYDVVLDVPRLCVERLRLRVEGLEARVSLDARVANLVRVAAGADVELGSLDLGIEGVRARALLLIDLENVVQIVDRTLGFIDAHPEIVEELVGTVDGAVGAVAQVAGAALQPGGLLSETLNAAGQTVRTTVDAAGSLVETTLDGAGNVVGTRTLGALTSLPVLQETRSAAGELVRRTRLPGGELVEYTLDAAGRVTGSRRVN
jgi:hypothetical protein